MSRSFKKTPGFTDGCRSKYLDKRFANKKVRNTQEIPNGKSYKKLYCSWKICDWKWLYFSKLEIEKASEWYRGRYKLIIK